MPVSTQDTACAAFFVLGLGEAWRTSPRWAFLAQQGETIVT
jgi:hypothetical protein